MYSAAQEQEDSPESTILRGLAFFLQASRLTTTTEQQHHSNQTTNNPEEPEQQQGLSSEEEDEPSSISQTTLDAAATSIVDTEVFPPSSESCLAVDTANANDGNDVEPPFATNL